MVLESVEDVVSPDPSTHLFDDETERNGEARTRITRIVGLERYKADKDGVVADSAI